MLSALNVLIAQNQLFHIDPICNGLCKLSIRQKLTLQQVQICDPQTIWIFSSTIVSSWCHSFSVLLLLYLFFFIFFSFLLNKELRQNSCLWPHRKSLIHSLSSTKRSSHSYLQSTGTHWCFQKHFNQFLDCLIWSKFPQFDHSDWRFLWMMSCIFFFNFLAIHQVYITDVCHQEDLLMTNVLQKRTNSETGNVCEAK